LRVQDEDDTPTVTFPDDYPNSVRHFLLIGFLGMFIGAIVFFYMGISRKVNTVMHVLTFFIAAVSACAYYAEWAGLGVEYKTTDTTPRVIFWAHYLDWVVTGPVRCLARYLLTSPVEQGAGRARDPRVRRGRGDQRWVEKMQEERRPGRRRPAALAVVAAVRGRTSLQEAERGTGREGKAGGMREWA